MRLPIRGFGTGARRAGALGCVLVWACSAAMAQGLYRLSSAGDAKGPKITIPTAPPENGAGMRFRDTRYGVRFQVPAGWNFTRKDREVSTFHLDARSAPVASELRAVASLGFNPFPNSVLSGALVYFSVNRHSNDEDCAAEAMGGHPSRAKDDVQLQVGAAARPQSIGGMTFLHGHDEHGYICVEGRDEVYTAYRKGSCYRFDLAVNTFCAVSSGASELSETQMHSLEEQMAGILSTVSLDWQKSGPEMVPAPEITPDAAPPASPRRPIPQAPQGKTSVGLGA